MFDHIGLRVKDLEAAARLYTAMLAPLGHVPGARGDGYAGFGPKDKPALWLHAEKKGGGCHVALKAADRAAVDAFHKAGLRAGAKDNGAPGLRADYGPTYYAAFLVDLDGNNVEAVCMR
ncbi:MAG TPA: VOC family protein [Burkholderiales bacterium]|nr:VOC family protein [Burkholderiales bacterium]